MPQTCSLYYNRMCNIVYTTIIQHTTIVPTYTTTMIQQYYSIMTYTKDNLS